VFVGLVMVSMLLVYHHNMLDPLLLGMLDHCFTHIHTRNIDVLYYGSLNIVSTRVNVGI